jgi:protoporphyrinogen oxidase
MIYDYIIIGAGISGLYSAFLLNGYKILVLEKNDYIGGRIKDVMFHDTLIRLGAGIAQEKSKNVINLLKVFKIKYTTSSSNKTIVGKNIDFDINQAIILIKAKFKQLKKEKNQDIFQLTFGEFLEKYFDKKFRSNYIRYSGYNDYIDGDITYHIKYYPIEDHSTKYSNKVYFRWSDLINKLKTNVPINLNTTVSKVSCENDIYCIDASTKQFYAKKVILAVSIGPLNYLIPKSNYMKYIGVMKYMRIYTYHKNGHNFKNDKTGSFNILIDENPLQKIIVISDKILMAAYCDSMNASYWLTMNQSELKINLLYWLRTIVPSTTEVDDVLCKFWDEAVHFYKPNKNIKYRVKKLQNPMKNVYVVGEVVSLRHGWVEGAIDSVDRIFQSITI